MTIDQVVNELMEEKKNSIPSRFPCRAIMVKNVQQYRELLSKLMRIPDISIVQSADLFSSADVMPRYEILIDGKYKDRWLILPGVSEYLRLFSKSEEQTQRFAKLWCNKGAASSIGRIIIPLWGCVAQWHDKALHLCEDERQDPYYYDCIDDQLEEQRMNLVVFSGEFEQYLFQLQTQKGHMLIGLQEWYDYWSDPQQYREDELLLTRRFSSILPSSGSINVRVIQDKFSFVKENLSNTEKLSAYNCPKEAQELLLNEALDGGTLDNAILRALNVKSFIGIDIMSKWQFLDKGAKQLAFLWLKLHPDDTYLCSCVRNSIEISDLNWHILHDIFNVYVSHSTWVSEYQKLTETIGLEKDEDFFAELDKIPVYEDRLDFISAQEKKDRIYLLHLVGKWMREDPNQAMASLKLHQKYPELCAYLGYGAYDNELNSYFSGYKSYKLSNTLPTDESLFLSTTQTDNYDYRYKLLSEQMTDSTVVLWIDALGAEWLPLLEWALRKKENGSVKLATVAQAMLPTETCYNDQWNQMNCASEKLDRLDKLAHKGVIDDPDYYSCVEEQISFVSGLGSKIDQLIKTYHRVIITGDHGTSRLAARFFHKRDGMPVPKGAVVRSHGRYCQLSGDLAVAHPEIKKVKDRDNNLFAVFCNYDHFVQPGFAAGADDVNAIYGEVHGGATPEEMLVPVIVFDSNTELQLSAKWQKNPVKIRAKNAKAILEFNCPVSSLQANITNIKGECSSSDNGKTWTVVFSGVKHGKYSVSIAADGNLVHADALDIQPALGGGDGDLL